MHASKSSIHPDTPILVLKSIFQRYDADRDGYLNETEFGNALDDLGIDDESEQCALFALADSNNSKSVQLEDFIKLIKSNDFEMILSNRQDYEFVIQTYHAFQQYDENGDGQITWNEFYLYLTKHGYSHQYISQYWYYMDTRQKLVISFEGFWKGFRVQANAIKQHQLQQVLNTEISNENEVKKAKKRSKKKSTHKKKRRKPKHGRILDTPDDRAENVFAFLKSQLKPTKQNKSHSKLQLGRVVEKDEPLPIFTDLKDSRATRLPDVIMNPGTPLHAILPSFRQKARGVMSILSPLTIAAARRRSSACLQVEQSQSHTSFTDLCCDISPSFTSNYSFTYTPKLTPYSNDIDVKGSPYAMMTSNDDTMDSDHTPKKRQKRKRRKKAKRKRSKAKVNVVTPSVL
eukprot:158603_1